MSTVRNPTAKFKQNTTLMMPSVQQQQQHMMMAPMQLQPLPPQANVPGEDPLTIMELSAADPKQQKQMLGERLYPLIQNINFNLAGKITGMLLEIDNPELLHMLESPESLQAKVDEALLVLHSHMEKQQQQQQLQQQ